MIFLLKLKEQQKKLAEVTNKNINRKDRLKGKKEQNGTSPMHDKSQRRQPRHVSDRANFTSTASGGKKDAINQERQGHLAFDRTKNESADCSGGRYTMEQGRRQHILFNDAPTKETMNFNLPRIGWLLHFFLSLIFTSSYSSKESFL